VPTSDQVLIPETLLKKRKAQQKTADDRIAAVAARKKVGYPTLIPFHCILKEEDKFDSIQ
jgi:hypothetical protein